MQALQIGLVNESLKQNEQGDAAYQHALKFAQEISINVIYIILYFYDIYKYCIKILIQ